MYFPFFILHQRSKISAIRPQTIYSEFPLICEVRVGAGLPDGPKFCGPPPKGVRTENLEAHR